MEKEMQTIHDGRRPRSNEHMVRELADKISTLARRAGQRGLRVDFEWLSDALDDRLARAVLQCAGFRRLPEQWAIGDGDRRIADYAYPPSFTDKLKDIIDNYDD